MNSIRIILVATFCSSVITCVHIEDNGYKGVTISFSKNVLDQSFDFVKLKNVLKNASELLFHATRKRSYFEELIFVVPSIWAESNDICDEIATEVPKSIDLYVTDSPDISSLTIRHSKGCGEKGDIIYLPKDWLKRNSRVEDLALEFIQQWSIFRYGVFPENPERPGSCITTSDSTWSPAGCYNIDLDVAIQFDENDGLPVCYFPKEASELEDLHSSIMFSANSSKIQDFCDGTDSFPHNPIAPTLHNRLCEGKTVWSVIKDTEDFRYGRNLPMEHTKVPKVPTFRCFKESKTHLTLMVQDTDSEARTEIRYSLFHFLSIIEPAEFSVTLATFSSDTSQDDTDSIEVNLETKENMKSLLDSHVKLNKIVQNVCLTCGFRKAYKVSKANPYPLRNIVLLARESSLQNTKISELSEIMQNDPSAVLYLLFLEDTVSDIIPSSLMDAVQENRGRIIRVKNDPVFMLTELNVALLDAAKSILHVEDKILVVHKREYVNVTWDITDVFRTPKNTKGKLLYSMQFKKRGDIKSINDSCSDMDNDLQSPICGSELNINDDQDSAKVWKYAFRYAAGSEGTICSSLALLKLDSSSMNSFTVRGWLSENKITPGHNTLIIYAEVYGLLEQNVYIEARISGPGLKEFHLQLRDNGNGDPDTIKGDNIYSRYFTSFFEKGTYTVSIYAEVLEAETNDTHTDENNSNETKVTQTKVIGTFRVTQTPPKEDILPPNRVSDLRVTSIDTTNRKVNLQWTAPGGDYDYGKAKTYAIKLSNHWMTLMDFTFSLKENVILEADEYHQPANNGITENVRIQCPLSNYNSTYYIALQAIDEKDNKGKVSNIIQIHFKEAYFPSNDTIESSTGSSSTYNLTTESSVSTEVTTDNFTSSITSIVIYESTTETVTNETKEGIFIEKNIFIIATSSFGAFILILIVMNIIICCCCFKKQQPAKAKKLSRKASLRPPYNLNIAYKHGSETSLEEDHRASHSLSALVDSSSLYSNSDGKGTDEKRYIYHTNKSLKSKMDNQSKRDDLGFKLVQPMPAYATSSLSRFAARHVTMDDDDENESSHTRHNIIQLQQLNNTDDTQLYPLGIV